MTAWKPSASVTTLKTRARLLQRIRAFFQARAVLEVETPLMSSAAVTDPHIESYRVQDPLHGKSRYLHTSPEFAMKRLLAAGSGPIFQLCRVFRNGEFGPLLEWLRTEVHAHGRRWTASELCRRVSGSDLSPEPLMRHLERKLRPLYDLVSKT